VQLFHDCDIQLLFRDQHFNVSTPKRRRYSHAKQYLIEGAANHAKSFDPILTGSVTILNSGWHACFEVGPDDGAKNQALPGSLLQTCPGLLDVRIFFQRRAQDLLQSDRADRGREKRKEHEN
jgi:hypothetical protein